MEITEIGVYVTKAHVHLRRSKEEMVLLDGLCRSMAGRVRGSHRQESRVAATGFWKRKAKEGQLTFGLQCDWPRAVWRVKQCTVLAQCIDQWGEW